MRPGVASVVLMVAILLAAPGPTHAFTYGFPSGLTCDLDVHGNEIVVNGTLAPQDAASVQAGNSVTLSAESSSPLTFAVASSPSLLSAPDIDAGPGVAQPPATATSKPTYTFTSIAAASAPRTIYWSASFPESGIPSCASLSPPPSNSVTSTVHSLTVLLAPVVQTPPPAPLRIAIRTQNKIRLSHDSVSYAAYCAASCTGETSYRVFAARPHRHAAHVPSLDLATPPISLGEPDGGTQQLTHHYKGHSLHTLKTLLREHDTVTLQITFKATSQAGVSTEAHRSARIAA
jgi:hypothetical protein